MNERRAMAVVGGLQGLALWLLTDNWSEDVVRVAAIIAGLYFISASGLVVHLARTGRDLGRLLGLAVAIGAAFGVVAFWVGWQLPPDGVAFDGDDARVVTWVLAAPIALFILGPFAQIFQRTGRVHFSYAELYRFSWNNFFVAALGLVYTGALWIVLILWAQLFDLIGIDFFEDLFAEEAFVYIVSGAAIGYGLAAARENERVIGALRGITQALFRAVLPVLCGVTLAFLATLPFTGLEPLFGARSAATVLLWWLAIGILLLNAVYQDGAAAPPYARPIRLLVEAGVLVTPALAGLAVYAVALRIDQHGLTPERMYAGLLALVFSLYALGYAAAVVLRGAPWLRHLRAVNVATAWVWIVLAFAVHTPLLDPLGWSLRNQLQRLESGRVDPVDFDYAYLRFHLGRRGAEALDRLAADQSVSEAVRERIDLALSLDHYWEWPRGPEAPVGELPLERAPEGAPWPEGLRIAIEKLAPLEWPLTACHERLRATCLVTPRDLDADGTAEELVFVANHGSLQVFVFSLEPDGAWTKVGRLSHSDGGLLGTPVVNDVVDAVRSGAFEAVSPRYSELEVEGRRLRFDPF